MTSSWISYNELAWTEKYFVNPEEYEDEVLNYIELIRKHSSDKPKTLLHLGSGAGGHDFIFKKYFDVTGVDISRGMLDIARSAHPDVEYIESDMKTVDLQRQFDAIVIPDSIDYMVTSDEFTQAITNAVSHLKPGGVLLVVGKTGETFQNNNFAYTGEIDDVHITLLENNYINPYKPNTYEAALMYLIRQKGELTIRTERQVLGLFPMLFWEKVFKDSGLQLTTQSLDGLYDKFILNEGEYPLTIFIGRKA